MTDVITRQRAHEAAQRRTGEIRQALLPPALRAIYRLMGRLLGGFGHA